MVKETKHVKVYIEDWQRLNALLFRLQFKRKERLSLADIVHEVLSATAEVKT